ncbi:MAG: serine protease [Solirubrobacteraceae bacterium]|nr:serine protease [Solirubrobacteraceae bacterium]
MRGRLALVTAVVAAFAAPAAAHAATYSVAAGGGGCGGADTACGTIAAAAGAAGPGDAVQISPGAYTESAEFAGGNITVTGSTDAPGVVVTGTLAFSGGATTPSVLQKLIVAAPTGAGPAVAQTGGAGVAVRDAVLLSADGPAMSITGGAANELTRSSALAAAASGTGVDVALGSGAASLTIDSSIISGGASGVGLAVKTGVGTLLSAGSASITAHHVTIAGAATAVSLDSSGATGLLSAQGNIVATATDSIVLGTVAKRNNAGLLGLVGPPNTASLTLTRTDQTTTAEALFVNPARRNYHLRADAPVIDKGQISAGESATDIDGQPRTTGAASDLGADEFANTAPTAMIAVKTPTPRATVPVTFDGSGSLDREAGLGGGIVEYRWTFGDGSTETTAVPTVDHIYAKPGTVVAQLVVSDRQGGVSEPVTAPVTLASGTAPAVVITRPKPKATLALLARKRKGAKRRKRATISFAGTAKAAAGVKSVVVTIEKLGSTKKTCTWLDKKKGLVKAPCAQPVLINAKLTSGRWTYTVAGSIKLAKGSYRISAYGTDNGGAFGTAAPAKRRVVRFTLK